MTPVTPLLGETSRESFFGSCWRARFLHLEGIAADRLAGLPSTEEVRALLARPAVEEASAIRYLSFPPGGNPVARSWLAGGAGQARRGADEPVNVVGAERCFPALLPFARELERDFGAPATLQLFYCEGRGGLAPHTDLNDSLVLQIAGRKRWRVCDVEQARKTSPLTALLGNAGVVLPEDARVIEMAPGDVLYKPSRAPHATETVEGPSLSLTASIATRTALDALLAVLRERLAGDPRWLERFPAPADDPAGRRIAGALDELAARLPSLAELEEACRR